MAAGPARRVTRAVLGLLLALTAAPSWAGDADVTKVAIRPAAHGTFDLDVTIRSKDTGWEAYADRIEALGPDGAVLGVRVLEHPHDTEQPFTRDLYGLTVPPGVTRVTVRARFKPAGYNGDTLVVTLPGRQSPAH